MQRAAIDSSALASLTRSLVDIDSTTGREGACSEYLAGVLRQRGFRVELQPVSEGRSNVLALDGHPDVVLSTHIDTVPPFMPSSEDAEYIHGRGACDAKGIVAAQVIAADRLRSEGVRDFGLLFLVGEETASDGARVANQSPRRSRYLVNGEPTGNKLILGTKGLLWLEVVTHGRSAHSAYPHLGASAIDQLLDVLGIVRSLPLPTDPVLGPTTLNIGLISGGRAPNVIPDEARAQVQFRTVPSAPGAPTMRQRVEEALTRRCDFRVVRDTPPLLMESADGFETAIAAFTTDLPSLSAWGRPLLIGPGSIEVAHTDHERVRKADLVRAVDLYVRLVRQLKARL